MLGLDEEPGILHGPRGPVPLPAGLARELAGRRGALWRRLLYDPATGVATDLSPGYRPRSRLAAFVRARDGEQTRFPTSGATRLELDHVRAYRHARPETGGQTRGFSGSSYTRALPGGKSPPDGGSQGPRQSEAGVSEGQPYRIWQYSGTSETSSFATGSTTEPAAAIASAFFIRA